MRWDQVLAIGWSAASGVMIYHLMSKVNDLQRLLNTTRKAEDLLEEIHGLLGDIERTQHQIQEFVHIPGHDGERKHQEQS